MSRQTQSQTPRVIPSSKISDQHLRRLAVVYIRQSSQRQVEHNVESTQLQYQLVDRAAAFGWPEQRVDIIDDDLGVSGRSIDGRNGFQRLLAEVSLDHVGIIFGIEMSRLARSCRDWHHLLELCSMFDTLLADADGVYDPRDHNDRLLLGLKGTMSEAELHVLRGRLREGQLNKARRGEFFTHAPIGYVRSQNTLVKEHDDQARSVVELVFRKFEELGSAAGVLRFLRDHKVQLGIRDHRSADRGVLKWRQPNASTLVGMLHHPIYAGAYVYGRREVNRQKLVPGQPAKGRRWANPEDWEVLIKDFLPSYISWETWEKNQKKLKENSVRYGTGAPRGGCLLASLVRCGRCGYRMSIYYANQRNARFCCDALRNHLAQTQCQGFSAKPLEALIQRLVLEAVSPASLELSIKAASAIESDRRSLIKNQKQAHQRASYESDLARRRYEEVDPSNRLVAAELEQRWESALSTEQLAEQDLKRVKARIGEELDDDRIRYINSLSVNIPKLWHRETTDKKDRQHVVRSLIEEVTVTVVDTTERVQVVVRWQGGYESHHEIVRAVGKFSQLESGDIIKQRILQLKRRGHTHEGVAADLNQSGYLAASGQPFTKQVVGQLCKKFRASGDAVDAIAGYQDHWTTKLLSQHLDVSLSTLRNWIAKSWLLLTKSGERWLVRANSEEIERLRKLAEHQRGPACRQTPDKLARPTLNQSNRS